MHIFEKASFPRQEVIHGLAVIGFIGLVGAGMWLAVYSTRFVPDVVGRISSAAVYLGSVFTPAPEESSLLVIPDVATTIPFEDRVSTSTALVSTTTDVTLPQVATKPAASPATVAGKATTSTHPLNDATTTKAAVITGLSDLTVKINAVGYLATTSASSFVASSTVPAGSRPAVKFTIKNIGTNLTGTWHFAASIPTQTAYVYQSPNQQTLAPGDSIEYTLGFDQATTGENKVISIMANYGHTITESNFQNNTASTSITVLGN